jgi:hypothetical protein
MGQIYDIIVVNEASGCLNAVTNQYTITGCNQNIIVRFDGINNAVGPFDIYVGSTVTTAVYTGVTRTEMIYGVVLTLTDSSAFCGTPTPTPTPTLTQTPTITSTPTPTPVVASHAVGSNLSISSANTCNDTVTIVNYYTYISEANLTPVNGAIVYQTNVSGTLFNPFNGNDRYIKMGFGGNFYVIQINSVGVILNYSICV